MIDQDKLAETLAGAQKKDAYLGKLLSQAREIRVLRGDRVSPNEEPFVPNRNCGSICDILERSR